MFGIPGGRSGRKRRPATLLVDDGDGVLSTEFGNPSLLLFTSVASAVNYLTVTNAATGNAPQLGAAGSDTDIGLILAPKGVGTTQILSTDAAAASGPTLDFYRNSASPASSDNIGYISFSGKDGAGNKTTFVEWLTYIQTTTNGAESGGFTVGMITEGASSGFLAGRGATAAAAADSFANIYAPSKPGNAAYAGVSCYETSGGYVQVETTAGLVIDDGSFGLSPPGNGGVLVSGKLITRTPGTLTIATGAITATGSYHPVDTEAAAATDDLDTISGGVAGMRLVIRAVNSARTVVAKDGTGNLQLAGDFSMDDAQDTLELIYDGTNWLELGRSTKAFVETVVTLTDGATPALNAANGNIFVLTAAGDRTIAVPSNATSGQKIIIRHEASGGARTLSLNTGAGGFRYGTDITGLTATTSGKSDYIGCVYDATDSFWDVVSYVKGF